MGLMRGALLTNSGSFPLRCLAQTVRVLRKALVDVLGLHLKTRWIWVASSFLVRSPWQSERIAAELGATVVFSPVRASWTTQKAAYRLIRVVLLMWGYEMLIGTAAALAPLRRSAEADSAQRNALLT